MSEMRERERAQMREMSFTDTRTEEREIMIVFTFLDYCKGKKGGGGGLIICFFFFFGLIGLILLGLIILGPYFRDLKF
jgi:hypothetical protein